MLNKIKSILTSIRFYQVVLAFGAELLAFYGVLPTEVARAIQGILGTSVVIGTADKLFGK